jgi:Gpi18-like mannosyltransferase
MASRRLSTQRLDDYLILAGGLALALALRASLLNFTTLDFYDFHGAWYDYIRDHGGVLALGRAFSNNTPLYQYLLVAAYYAGLSALHAVKFIPICSDFVTAFFAYRIVRLRHPTGSIAAYAFLAVLFIPTVVLNGSFWGETDMLYTSCLVACLYFLLVKKNALGLIAFGLAFSFKLQALFLAPFLLILLVKRAVSWKYFLLVPAIYLVTLIPAWWMGRPLSELLQIYLEQPDMYRALTMNAPTPYQWFPSDLYDILYPAGMIWGAAMVFFFVVLGYKSRAQLTDERLIAWATLSVLIVPYVLPKMHDRFFFPADVFSVLLAFYVPRLFVVPLVVCAVSFFGYFPFLFGYEVIPLRYLAIALLVPIVLLARHLFRAETA